MAESHDSMNVYSSGETTKKKGSQYSTPEEINKQHAAAVEMIQTCGIQFAQPKWQGEIPLRYKQRPVCPKKIKTTAIDDKHSSSGSRDDTPMSDIIDLTEERNAAASSWEQPTLEAVEYRQQREERLGTDDFVPCWSSRGFADVSRLQALVRNGYNRKYKLDVVTPKSTSFTKNTTKNTSKSTAQNGVASSSTTNARPKTAKSSSPTSAASAPPSSDSSGETPMNFWDPVNAAMYNVPVRRQSHDAWGIPKIVLLFCDDFCQDQYELPWYWQKQTGFADAVQPVLDVLQIPIERVVRLLLASLPAHSSIPVHADSGEWVKRTHRVHVPVLVNDVNKILFRCGDGPSLSDLDAIQCTPGHVFEINNQAQHAVSNVDDEYRVHLILDYVDEDFVRYKNRHRYLKETDKDLEQGKVRLQPGEVLMQTLRSIDRLACKGQRPTPSFMILGAQKAGTTFLFESIMQHPLVVKPRDDRRETHCLDWRWNESANMTTEQRFEACREFYYWKELQLHPSCLTGDSTPSYLLDSRRVIPRIKQVFPWRLQFFVTCRDPVARAESHYAMVTSPHGTPAQLKSRGTEWRSLSIDQVIVEDFMKLQACGVFPYWSGITVGTTSLKDAKFDPETFASFSGSLEEDAAWNRYLQLHVPLSTGSYGILSRGLYELQLRPWFRAFNPNDFMVLRLEAMAGNSKSNVECLAATLEHVWHHLGVPPIAMTDEMAVPRNSRDYDRHAILSHDSRDFLRQFYQPHNERLLRFLQHHKPQQNGEMAMSLAWWDQHWTTTPWEPEIIEVVDLS